MLFLCVSVYCHRVTTQLQLINIIIIIIIIIIIYRVFKSTKMVQHRHGTMVILSYTKCYQLIFN